MKLLAHALVIAGVLVGSDWIANGGAETQKVLAGIDAESVLIRAKVSNYQLAASVRQSLYETRPQIVAFID